MQWSQLSFFSSSTYKDIVKFLVEEKKNGKTIVPSNSTILRAFALTPFDDVKVVILGQDPYPTIGHATGLAFSVPNSVSPLPKSLQNIYKELATDVGVQRKTGDLTDWAEQGVLLLNTSLTLAAGQPNSHKGIGWEKLTQEVVQTISDEKDFVVFILWGQNAINKSRWVDEEKHRVITSPHPSPLSASRGFFGSRPFSTTNKYLSEHKMQPIIW